MFTICFLFDKCHIISDSEKNKTKIYVFHVAKFNYIIKTCIDNNTFK